jgi:hypothetical protein
VLNTDHLLHCFACNNSYHKECMLGLKWGLTGLGLPAPWCRDCYEEWVVYGCTPTSPVCLAARNTAVRGETALQYKEPVRLPGPALGADPREKFAFGRRRVR